MPKRRAHGEGSLYQRKDGLFVAVIQLGRDPSNGRRLRRSFYGRTQKDALAKRKQFLRDLDEGLVSAKATKRAPYTVATWMDYWLQNVVEPECEPTTLESYTLTVNNHVKPYLGAILLTELDTDQVDAWLRTMRDRKIGLRTRQLALARLRTALTEAVARRQQTGVRFNAAGLAKMPRGPKPSVAPPNLEHARALLDAARGEPLEALVTICLGLGLRRGEAVGLRWEDIDMDKRQIQIRRRVARVKGRGLMVRAGMKMNPDKVETIALPTMVIDALRAHRARQVRLPTGYVFVTERGTVVDPREASRFFERVRHRAGVESKTLHHLRHDFAGLLLTNGVPLWVVSQILRHKSVSMTADYYAHLTPELHMDAADTMDAVLRPLVNLA